MNSPGTGHKTNASPPGPRLKRSPQNGWRWAISNRQGRVTVVLRPETEHDQMLLRLIAPTPSPIREPIWL